MTDQDGTKSTSIRNHRELQVYQRAFDLAMRLFEASKSFPVEERYSLIDQMRRSSRSVTSNLAEAWRKRRYEAAFRSKLNDAEAEAAETQTWIEYAVACGYMDAETTREIYREYDNVLRTLVGMINHPESWILTPKPPPE